MSGLPRSIIKKYGVSKKAWAVYRSSGATTKRATSSRRSGNMSRRFRTRSRCRSGGIGGIFNSKGMLGKKLPVKGILGLVACGVLGYLGAPYAQQIANKITQAVPQAAQVPYQKEIITLPVLGIAGSVGAYFNKTASTNSSVSNQQYDG
jgi:hypothetical protein